MMPHLACHPACLPLEDNYLMSSFKGIKMLNGVHLVAT